MALNSVQLAAIIGTVVAVLIFALAALYLALRTKNVDLDSSQDIVSSKVLETKVNPDSLTSDHNNYPNKSTEFFLTARSSVSTSQIAWSFYSTAIGSWVIYALPAFSCDEKYGAGVVGLIVYSLFAGLPLIIVSYAGDIIRDRYPNTISWGHFAQQRFGKATQVYVSILVMINMGISLTAEYTAIGCLFNDILNISPFFPVFFTGTVTMIYTITGGLYVSILTDKWQALFSMALILFTFIYVCITFRADLGPLPPYLAPNERGYESLVTIGVAITCASFFSDAIWQRVWASADSKTLKRGSALGCSLAIIVAFLFGFGGFLATWANRVESNEASTSFFKLFDMNTNIGVIVSLIIVIVAVVMNESSVDTFQNALTDSVVSVMMSFGYNNVPLWLTRACVVIFNIPIMIIGSRGYNINGLYLITNVLVSASTMPLLLGLYKKWQFFIKGIDCICGCLGGIILMLICSTIIDGQFIRGAQRFIFEEYAWHTFAETIIGSTIITLISATITDKFKHKFKFINNQDEVENI